MLYKMYFAISEMHFKWINRGSREQFPDQFGWHAVLLISEDDQSRGRVWFLALLATRTFDPGDMQQRAN